MVLAGMFYAALTTMFDVDTGIDKVVAAMSDDLPQVVCVLWPPLARDRDGEQDEYGAQSSMVCSVRHRHVTHTFASLNFAN
jgi:hypothetical protein